MRFFEDPLSLQEHLAWKLRQARWAASHGIATAKSLALDEAGNLDALAARLAGVIEPLLVKVRTAGLAQPGELDPSGAQAAYSGDRDAAIIAARCALDDAIEHLQSAYRRAKGTPWNDDFMRVRIEVFQAVKPLRDALLVLEVEALGNVRSQMSSMLRPPESRI